jgi:hypothetical protein
LSALVACLFTTPKPWTSGSAPSCRVNSNRLLNSKQRCCRRRCRCRRYRAETAAEGETKMRKRRYIIVSGNGPACPRCGRPTQVRRHDRIRPKQLRQPFYYKRWFYCKHNDCRTTLYMQEAFKVWNDPFEGGEGGELRHHLRNHSDVVEK